jgi:hypothetical protein
VNLLTGRGILGDSTLYTKKDANDT